MEKNALEEFHHYLLLPWYKILSPFRKNNKVLSFPFPFQIFLPFVNLWLSRPPRTVFPKDVRDYKILVGGSGGMLLVSRSGLVEENAVEMLHHYGFHISICPLNGNSQLVGRVMLLWRRYGKYD